MAFKNCCGGGGTDTSDANAIASDIMPGKTAYVNDVKLTGTATSDANATAADIISGKSAYINGVKITGSNTLAVYENTSTANIKKTYDNSIGVILPNGLTKNDILAFELKIVWTDYGGGTRVFGGIYQGYYGDWRYTLDPVSNNSAVWEGTDSLNVGISWGSNLTYLKIKVVTRG